MTAYQAHSETSREAAETVKASDWRERILQKILEAGSWGATNDELSALHDKTGSYFSPRLIELERAQKIFKLIDTRPTRAGKSANVYIHSEHFNPLLHRLAKENRKDDDWQPIETAPKEYTKILAWDGHEVEIIYWSETFCSHGCYIPTHWKPAPQPPRI